MADGDAGSETPELSKAVEDFTGGLQGSLPHEVDGSVGKAGGDVGQAVAGTELGIGEAVENTADKDLGEGVGAEADELIAGAGGEALEAIAEVTA